MKTSDEPILIKISVHSSPQKVWNALTDVSEMRGWYFDNIPAFEPKPGFETQFDIMVEDRIFRHIWQVTEVIPLKKIAYSWRYEAYTGSALVSFEIKDRIDFTEILFRCNVTENFEENIPEFQRESALEGWNYFIKKSLQRFLD